MKLSNPAVRELLARIGPMTMRELAEFFPENTHWNVSSAINSMRRAATKRVYIYAWDREVVEKRQYLRPIYALGDSKDARKPKALTDAEKSKRWRVKNKIPKINSVWTWRPNA